MEQCLQQAESAPMGQAFMLAARSNAVSTPSRFAFSILNALFWRYQSTRRGKIGGVTPNGLQAQDFTFEIPQNPVIADETTAVPLVGVSAIV